ncbi:MAG: transcriptional repressor [Oscillospiraceae bacterium]|jgi:Fe2+ or Zn2+ uptake regulation protein|nr:transcriptional repressor [Oscillospiraceae bacterium]
MERNTHQKQCILNALEELRGEHPTAEKIYETVSQTLPTISRATVYRVLNQFAGQGVLLQLHVPDSGDHYDNNTMPHSHLLCCDCKRVVDLESPQLPTFDIPSGDASGCRITGVEVLFLGQCPHCAAKF